MALLTIMVIIASTVPYESHGKAQCSELFVNSKSITNDAKQ